jgi:hypothetical protein
MTHMKHWQDPVNGALGAWLILSPWVVGFQDNRIATVSIAAVGLLLVATALGAILLPRAWEEWTGAALGAWLMASPWILGYASVMPAVQVAICTGLAVAVLALWVLATDKDYGGWWSRMVG